MTIHIPAYNEERHIVDTVRSALGQTYQDILVVVTDNSSADSTHEICRQVHDARLRLLRHPKNIGAASNMRYGLDISDSPFFMWLGAHDILDPTFIQEMLAAHEAEDSVALAYPQFADFLSQEGTPLGSNDACSQIDTGDETIPYRRFAKVASTVRRCTNVHGLFRANVLRAIPWQPVLGFDGLLLAASALHGHIRGVPTRGLLRRVVREETPTERLQRWEKEQMLFSHEEKSRSLLIALHLRTLMDSEFVSAAEKLDALLFLRRVLKERYLNAPAGKKLARTLREAEDFDEFVARVASSVIERPSILLRKGVLRVAASKAFDLLAH